MSEVWSICPIPNTEAIVTIKDENGLEIGTCIAEDAPMIVLAPELIEFAQMVAAGNTEYKDLERSANALLLRAKFLGDELKVLEPEHLDEDQRGRSR